MMVDLRPDHLEIVKRILAERVPEYQVRSFGSRTRWTAKDTSDLDLVVMTDAPLDLVHLADLREDFSESDLPFRVDVLDWAATGVEFREIIEQDYAVIQQPGSTGSSGPTWMRSGMAGEIVETVYGPISSDFVHSLLGGLCVPDRGVQTGPFGSLLHASDYVDSGTPIITVEHLGDNRIIHENLPYVSDEDKDRLSKYILKTGDIVFSRVGSVDRRAIVHPEEDGWLFSGRCLRVRPDPTKIDADYLSWFLGLPGFKEYIRQIAVGATMPSLNTTILSNVPIYLPTTVQEQQAIACILGTLDDKIELNRRMNQTLEGMARAIFKSWFVDFDPVRAKAQRKDAEAQRRKEKQVQDSFASLRLGGSALNPTIADLFPDAFEASELGEIPKGWEVGTLGMIANEVRDTVQPAEIEPGTPYIALQHMPRRCIALNSWDMADDIASAKLRFKVGDILFGKLRPYFHKVGPAPLDGVCSTDIVVCRPQDNLWHGLTLGHMSSDAFVAYTDSGSTGTKMPRTNWRYMSAFRIALPPSRVAAQFVKIVRPMIDRIRQSIFEQQTLAALRDTLLPKLISGELRVLDTEKFCLEVGR